MTHRHAPIWIKPVFVECEDYTRLYMLECKRALTQSRASVGRRAFLLRVITQASCGVVEYVSTCTLGSVRTR